MNLISYPEMLLLEYSRRRQDHGPRANHHIVHKRIRRTSQYHLSLFMSCSMEKLSPATRAFPFQTPRQCVRSPAASILFSNRAAGRKKTLTTRGFWESSSLTFGWLRPGRRSRPRFPWALCDSWSLPQRFLRSSTSPGSSCFHHLPIVTSWASIPSSESAAFPPPPSRWLPLQESFRARPLRLLFMACAPTDQPTLDYERRRRRYSGPFTVRM